MPVNKNEKVEVKNPAHDKLGKIDHAKGARMLKELTRKKYRVTTNATAWSKRGCYYTGSDSKK